MRVLVTGASGLLGINLSLLAAQQGHEVTGLVHTSGLKAVPFQKARVDLLNDQEALSVIESAQPDAIIHCAALANLNAAEQSPDLAYRLNGEIPGILAGAAKQWGISFVQISTDAVFDGKKGGYSETDPPNPLSVYARSKLAGEVAVREANPDAVIARVVFFGWSLSGIRSLSEFFFNNFCAGHQIQGFSDTYFCPLYAEDLSTILLDLLTAKLSGTYHIVSPESVSKYEFGLRIANKFGFDEALITPVKADQMNRQAPRSLNLTLKPDKVQAALGYALPNVDAGIDGFFQRWQEGYPEQLQNYAD